MTRRRYLSPAQKRAIAADGVTWVGWDAKGRPVIRTGLLEYALTREGNTINLTSPVDRAP